MKLTKQIKADLAKAYQCAMEISILDMKAPLRYINQYIAENVSGYGTAADEKVKSKEDYRKMLMKSRQQAKGMLFKAKIITPYRPKFIDETTAQFHDEILVQIGDKKNKHSIHLYMSCVYKYQFDKWQLVLFHGSMPDAASTTEDTFHIGEAEKKLKELEQVVAERTADLQRKTRELEIEASLERVRAVTMGMNKPGDILDICKIFFNELQSLGFADLRNTLINFWDDENGQLHDYDYSDFAGGNFAKLAYSSHPAFAAFQKKIRKAKDAFAKLVINKDGLKSWRQRRRSSGEYNDPRLSKISALYYYFYSTGVGALGISTFSPISKEEVEVLKRFRNVFDMAYQRYTDIQKAEAQAREAQIEAALERVRSRTMAMHKTDELLEAAELVGRELSALGVTSMNVSYAFVDDDEKQASYYSVNPVDGKILSFPFIFPHTETKVMRSILSSWKKQEPFNVIELDQKATLKHQTWVGEHIQNLITKNNSGIPFSMEAFLEVSPKKAVIYTFNFKQGYLFNIGGERLTSEKEELVLRFTKVFEMTYRRFLDLKQAEEQTREAQIELGLERVRARAMAMQNSDELKELIGTVFIELTKLDLVLTRCLIMIYDTQSNASTWWMANSEAPTEPIGLFVKNHKLPPYAAYIKAWKERKNKWQYILEGKDKNDWDDFLFVETELSQLPDFVIAGMKAPDRVCLSASFNNFGCLNLATLEPLSDEHFDILLRFAKVFDLTYTRFNDLQKAETQAKESQIELGLERVRARTMAMQHSNELPDAAIVLFQQVQSLGMPAWSAGYCTWNEDKSAVTLWMSSEGVLQPPFTAPTTKDELFIEMRKGQEDGKTFHVVEMGGKKLEKHYKYMRTLPVVGEILDSIIAAGHPLPTFQIMHHAYFSKGFLLFITYEPVPDAHGIFKRFGKVFDQTYTRFLDLQKAETQARQAKIEAAMEKVRSRAMAMQKPHELVEVAKLLRKEMGLLGVEELETSSIYIHHEDTGKTECWYAIKDVQHPEKDLVSDHMIIDLDETAVGKQMLRFYHSGKKKVSIPMQGDARKEWINYCADHSKVLVGFYGDNIPDRTYHLYKFTNGYMGAASPGEISAESWDLLQRATSVFSLAYTRFSDLQQAEAQAREAQIEAALERVRSRSIGMQKSEELKEVIKVLYDQFVHLNINLDHAGFVVDYEPKGDWHFWIADKQEIPSKITHPYFDSVWAKQFDEAKEKGIDFFATHLNFEEKNKFYKELLSHVPGLPEASRDFYLSCPGLAASTVLLENVGLYIENFSGTPYTDEENSVLMRFGKVFQQTYTRFLDLQKAEAQARENQIQLALERVRARTMAMQKSDELKDVARELRVQLALLGTSELETCAINLYEEHEDFLEAWVAVRPPDSRTDIIEFHFNLPKKGIYIIEDMIEAYASGVEEFVFDLAGEKGVQWMNTMSVLVPDMFTAAAATPDFIETGAVQAWFSCHYFSGGAIIMITMTPPLEESLLLLKRCTQVFGLAYRRFADLKKAEHQAREAQIEAALERVRSKSMAMHKSEELADLSLELVKQVQALGVSTWFCAFNINDDDSQGSLEWGSNGEGTFPKYRTPREGIFLRYYEAGQRGETLFVNEIGENECPAHYEYLCSLPGVGEQLLAMKAAGIPFPSFQIDHVAFFKYGYVLFITYEPVPDAHDIFKRFAKVFEQTYTRFLDLQRAEAQAKEAQIEAALEKVRSRSLAMHKSDELNEVVAVLFEKLKELKIPATAVGIAISIDGSKDLNAYVCGENEDGLVISNYRFPYFSHKIPEDFNDARQKQLDLFVGHYSKQEKNSFYEYLFEHVAAVRQLPEDVKRMIFESPAYTITMIAVNNAVFNINDFEGKNLSENEVDIIKRFARVFDQAYTRFLDLQKAEAQTKEAQIEAALEKVRSRTMAMQSSNELQETAAVLFNEFKKLGTEDIYQVTIGIYNEEQGVIDFRVTSWDGSGVQENRSFNLDMNEPTVLQPAVSAWRANKKSLVIDLSGEALEGWLNYRNKMSGITVSSNDTAGRRVISVAYYSKGHLSISTPVPVPAETLRTLERFAAVFDATYTRFLDLQKAEAQAKESKIEAALERVRSRTLAMQKSDELAETAAEVFKQLIGLGIEPNRLYIGIVKDETGDMEMWATDEDGTQVGKKFTFNKNENASVLKLYDGWKAKKKSVIVDMQGKELEDYFHYLNNVMHIPFKGGLTQKRRVQSVAYFSKGFIGMASPDGQGDETIQLLERFAAVFNLTFTRFNDLKIAEAHAQQAEQDLIAIKEAKQKAEEALTELQSTQKQLIQSEKMASLGELTAGIAHEIQNPLNFVNNFSDVSKELLDEMKEAIEKGDTDEAKEIMNDVIQNLEKINHHGKRADGIVKGMLQHSRSSSGTKEPTDINALADEYLRLAYHGLRAKDKSFNATLKTDFDESIGKVSMIPQDIGRVILNLITNAFYVVAEKKARNIEGYEPTVFVSTIKEANNILVSVRDNGNGIPPNVLDKIFQPFFTTKPTGQGTGLGLSLAYDIVKAHAGELKVETKEGEGATFIIILPSN